MMLFTENGNTDGGGSLVTKLCLTLLSTRTITYQDPLSKGFPRQEYWSELPLPSPGIFPTQRSNPCLLHYRQILQQLEPPGKPTLMKEQLLGVK